MLWTLHTAFLTSFFCLLTRFIIFLKETINIKNKNLIPSRMLEYLHELD